MIYRLTRMSASINRHAYFDEQTQYIGCAHDSGERFYQCIGSSWLEEDGVRYPVALELKEGAPNQDSEELPAREEIHISLLQINHAIPPSVFTLDGLGVGEGNLIAVRDGSLGESEFELGVLRGGKLVPADSTLVNAPAIGPESGQPVAGSTSPSLLIIATFFVILSGIVLIIRSFAR